VILWTTSTDDASTDDASTDDASTDDASTGDAGAADTRELAATEAVDSVLARWGRQHPCTGGAELVTICVDGAEAYAGPAIDADGFYDAESTTVVLHQIRDHLATDLS
jgi:hypothetical protein